MVVQYPSFRSSTCKYDPCVSSQTSLRCSDCRVQLISDRFLGKQFMRNVMRGMFHYPYVLIADTAGCNMRCWFCYSWQYWTFQSAQEQGCNPVFVSPQRLAEQFQCKFRLMADLDLMIETARRKTFVSEDDRRKGVKHIARKYPVRGIRISGGEPLYATSSIMQPYEGKQPVDYARGIDYWTTFFRCFDEAVGQLTNEGGIHLIDRYAWDWSHPHLSVLTNNDGRLHIRFDTNGIAFGDHEFCRARCGDMQVAEMFVEQIYRLHEQGKLENTQIMIDYSLKGATPTEFFWSQRQSLPINSDINTANFRLDQHPQYGGFKNLQECILKRVQEDPLFSNCLYLSLEKGIENGRHGKFFVNHVGALDWEPLENRLGVKFSEVSNQIDVADPWRYSAQIYRYLKPHARARMIASSQGVTVDSCNDGAKPLIQFIRKHRKLSDFEFVVYPDTSLTIASQPRIHKQKKAAKKPLPLAGKDAIGWIFTGNMENWNVALQHGIWGVSHDLKPRWDQMSEDQLVFFYVTKPISGIIGYGTITQKAVEQQLLWPNEIRESSVIYPYRIRFNIGQVFPQHDWINKRISLRKLPVTFYRGANAITNETVLEVLKANFE